MIGPTREQGARGSVAHASGRSRKGRRVLQSRTRLGLLGALALVVVCFFIVFRPLTLHPRTGPDTKKPIPPVDKLGPVYLYPPYPSLSLGLDLRGGIHLVLQAQKTGVFEFSLPKALTEDTEKAARDAIRARVSELITPEALKTAKRTVDIAGTRVRVRSRVTSDKDMSRQGGIMLAALREAYPGAAEARRELITVTQKQLREVKEVIRRRVDATGLSEAIIQEQPPDRIVIEIPGVKDPDRAQELISKTAVLEFRAIPRRYAYGEERPPESDKVGGREVYRFRDRRGNEAPLRKVLDESDLVVTGADLKPNSDVSYGADMDPAVSFEFMSEGRRVFADHTRKHQNEYLAIVLDGEIISAPKIREPIPTGAGVIEGGFRGQSGLEEARDLSTLLNAGALPVDLESAGSQVVSATLGQDSLDKSLFAGMIGMIVVLIFMVAYYRLPGLLADAALIVYIILLLAVLRVLNATLTLPGIFGIILSIGMAVDANVIIFERLKEELRSGKTLRSAIDAGFNRAWTAILDSNICSIITGLVLYGFGTGPIKGFAITLVIGVAASLFTAVTITRLFMRVAAGSRFAERLSLLGAPSLAPRPASSVR